MKFSTREDIDAPIENVFDMICDFEIYERAAMRRGAEVQRLDSLKKPAVGVKWSTRFMLRGKERDLGLEVTTCDAPTDLVIALQSRNMTGQVSFELFALSRTKTRMIVAVEVRPETLPARLLIQSLKLTKTSLTRKYKEKVAGYVVDMEERYRREA